MFRVFHSARAFGLPLPLLLPPLLFGPAAVRRPLLASSNALQSSSSHFHSHLLGGCIGRQAIVPFSVHSLLHTSTSRRFAGNPPPTTLSQLQPQPQQSPPTIPSQPLVAPSGSSTEPPPPPRRPRWLRWLVYFLLGTSVFGCYRLVRWLHHLFPGVPSFLLAQRRIKRRALEQARFLPGIEVDADLIANIDREQPNESASHILVDADRPWLLTPMSDADQAIVAQYISPQFASTVRALETSPDRCVAWLTTSAKMKLPKDLETLPRIAGVYFAAHIANEVSQAVLLAAGTARRSGDEVAAHALARVVHSRLLAAEVMLRTELAAHPPSYQLRPPALPDMLRFFACILHMRILLALERTRAADDKIARTRTTLNAHGHSMEAPLVALEATSLQLRRQYAKAAVKWQRVSRQRGLNPRQRLTAEVQRAHCQLQAGDHAAALATCEAHDSTLGVWWRQVKYLGNDPATGFAAIKKAATASAGLPHGRSPSV